MSICAAMDNRRLMSYLACCKHTAKRANAQDVFAWTIAEAREELHRRGFTADSTDQLSGARTFGSDGSGYYKIFPLGLPADTWREMVEGYYERAFMKTYTDLGYDCTGQAFTDRYYAFIRRGEWWIVERINIDC